MPKDNLAPRDHPLAQKLYEIIFKADTFWGKAFDLGLLAVIVVSVTAVSLETVNGFDDRFHRELMAIEWICTILFTLEYFVRIWCLRQPRAYIFSFYGIVDLLSFLPAYIGLVLQPGSSRARSFAVIRALRLLRVFRIMELSWLESEAGSLRKAVWDARAKVVVFFVTVLIVVTIAGAAMYEIEHMENSQFESIPQSVYWAIITMTTVGYGDVVPQTIGGKLVAAILVLLGYSLIIVPTGFVSAELTTRRSRGSGVACSRCGHFGQSQEARYCDRCGSRLPP
jgi:voltage-gated potassium channel